MIRAPLLACALAAVAAAAPAGARAAGLKLVVAIAASGVQVPNEAPLRPYASRPWPRWRFAPGTLTPHGTALMEAFGAYYRAHYARAGLFDAAGCNVSGYAYSSPVPAARASAQALLAGFAPGCNLTAEAAPAAPDPLFDPVPAIAKADGTAAQAALSAALGSNETAESSEDTAAMERLDSLLDCASNACRRVAKLPSTTAVDPATGLASMHGRVAIAADATVALRMEYDDALPGPNVGWGHVDRAILREITRLPVLRQRLDDRNAYAARAKASNLAAQLLETLRRRKGFAALVGSPSNVAALGGLLGASWTLPGAETDDVPPGGALVFELHDADRRGGEPYVRAFFVAQADDAMRRAGTSAVVPVLGTPVHLAGCQSDDCPQHVFDDAVRAAIDPAFVSHG